MIQAVIGRAQANTLYNRAGGADGVAKLVEPFYARVLKDPALRPFFETTPIDELWKMQEEFFSAKFLDYLLETLKDQKLSEPEVYNIISRVNLYADEVTGQAVDVG